MRAMKCCLSAAAGAMALGLATVGAQAAPAAGGTADLQAAAGTQSSVEKAAYRRCWWRHGVRHCRWVGDEYGYSYPYYYGPSYGLYFGGGHRHHRHHHHH